MRMNVTRTIERHPMPFTFTEARIAPISFFFWDGIRAQSHNDEKNKIKIDSSTHVNSRFISRQNNNNKKNGWNTPWPMDGYMIYFPHSHNAWNECDKRPQRTHRISTLVQFLLLRRISLAPKIGFCFLCLFIGFGLFHGTEEMIAARSSPVLCECVYLYQFEMMCRNIVTGKRSRSNTQSKGKVRRQNETKETQ